jgi:DNA helicase-2/ATP-dependent DNA helicase PcrA
MQLAPETEGSLETIGERDHAETSEYRIFGPPGTGKTTNLSRQIRRAVNRFGPDSVLVTSFTRAAAAELAGRDLPISPHRIGTLHSHCWRALDGPAVAETQVEEWNRSNPNLRITPLRKKQALEGESGADDSGMAASEGDRWLQDLNRCRGMMLPEGAWPAAVRSFARRWTEYKQSLGLLDFCDLIETTLAEIPFAPGQPSVIFADEAQDLNRMQLSLVRKWGERAQYFILAADDDQTIYSWTGATPEAVLDPEIPEDHKIILKQSYRVPKLVHALAQRLIHQVGRRQPKDYRPRPADGECHQLTTGTYKTPEYGILKAVLGHLDKGHTVMLLATCTYMIEPVIAVLRKNGIPFHNPFRRANGFWNPIRKGQSGSATNRVLALLAAHPAMGDATRPWTFGDLALWTEWLTAKGILKTGAKTRITSATPDASVSIATLDELFEPKALESLLDAFEGDHRRLLTWWRQRLTASMQTRAKFPVMIAHERGPAALEEAPKVIVGTIHSVKGGEADAVFLFPDLSQAGDAAYQRVGPARDAVIRLFYVGVTRARQALYLCQRESAMAFHW